MTPSQVPALDSVKLAIASTNDLFCVEVCGKRNFDALDLIYTSDARILPPGAPIISGRESIKEFWAGLVSSLNVKSARLTPIDIIPAGDGMLEIGQASIEAEPAGQSPAVIEGKYVVYWRQEDARWKLHVDIWNLNA
jgi:ketosteroid isomerase-like protein